MARIAFQIRPMNHDEMASFALEWAAREGWNPGLDDAEPFHAADPAGFLLGELDGEPVGCISAVGYDASFGFLGFYLVKPEHRGKGYGMRLWRAALERLGGRNIGLDGVLARQDDYKRSGFTLAYSNIRYLLPPRRTDRAEVAAARGRVIAAAARPFPELAAFDRLFFPAPREEFLRRWIAQPHATALAALNAEGRLSGYGVIRACRDGYKIGPLFADGADIAETLFHALLGEAADSAPVFLDIPAVNSAALDLARRHAMQRVFETARMYSRERPALPLEKIYGVTTFELG